jgi:hypothetical protein
MKSDTLNGILTFVLGVLVVLGVICAVRMVLLTHELRYLQRQATTYNSIMVQTEAMYNDAQAYYQKNQDPALARILQTAQAKPANH